MELIKSITINEYCSKSVENSEVQTIKLRTVSSILIDNFQDLYFERFVTPALLDFEGKFLKEKDLQIVNSQNKPIETEDLENLKWSIYIFQSSAKHTPRLKSKLFTIIDFQNKISEEIDFDDVLKLFFVEHKYWDHPFDYFKSSFRWEYYNNLMKLNEDLYDEFKDETGIIMVSMSPILSNKCYSNDGFFYLKPEVEESFKNLSSNYLKMLLLEFYKIFEILSQEKLNKFYFIGPTVTINDYFQTYLEKISNEQDDMSVNEYI
jgi:hypothetical protein